MPRCTRKGCGVEFTEGGDELCAYHPGAPIFHEGLKSWSCCQDIYKPVLDFDEFMTIPLCTEIKGHSSAAVADAPKASTSVTQSISLSIETSGRGELGQEVFHVGLPQESTPSRSVDRPAIPAPVLEEDDLSTAVPAGTVCRRKGCGVTFDSDEVNRQGDGEGAFCHYHPLPPIFREGSKGYLCCKRRVLEFEEFLKIRGCQTGRHCFIPVVNNLKADEQVECRVDHYQTPNQVHVSIFAKQVDTERSSVQFEASRVKLDLYLPGNRRFTKTIDLFGSIDPNSSTFQYFGTKVELRLKKTDTRSWTVLEKTERDLGNISLTFGVGGRTGTIGGKELILDESNNIRSE